MQKSYADIEKMTPDELKAYKTAQRAIVFGSDAPKDRFGKPKEQGIGSPLQPSINHVEALRKAEPNNIEAIQKAEAALAEFQKTSRAKTSKNLLADL
jgi:hypothetical protein